MASSGLYGMAGPDHWLRDRVPTLTEVLDDVAAPADVSAADRRAEIDAAVDAAVQAALRQWRSDIEPLMTQMLADAVAKAVREVLERPFSGPQKPIS